MGVKQNEKVFKRAAWLLHFVTDHTLAVVRPADYWLQNSVARQRTCLRSSVGCLWQRGAMCLCCCFVFCIFHVFFFVDISLFIVVSRFGPASCKGSQLHGVCASFSSARLLFLFFFFYYSLFSKCDTTLLSVPFGSNFVRFFFLASSCRSFLTK